jgi:hypothetical protein
MSRIRTFLLVAATALPALALAQWAWVDASGRRVYSDQPPPPSIPDRSILQQPTPRGPVITIGSEPSPAATPARPATPGNAARAGGRDTEAQRAAAAAEAEKRKAEEERIARMKADNCQRARGALATLASGARIVRTNEKGEREFLDDAARASETQRLQEIIGSDCATN